LNPFGAEGRRAWNNRGASLDNLRRHDDAIDSYEEAIMIDPFDIYAWNNKGVALSALGRHDEAIKCFDKAILIQPGYTTAWKNKSVALQATGRDTEAKDTMGLARKLELQ
jgi:superkiller protein 3